MKDQIVRFDPDQFRSIVDSGDQVRLLALRDWLTNSKQSVERQMLQEQDAEKRVRLLSLKQTSERWLSQIKRKRHELGLAKVQMSAVAVAGAGTSAQLAADALNGFLRAGCHIAFSVVVGRDLVVVAAEPRRSGDEDGEP